MPVDQCKFSHICQNKIPLDTFKVCFPYTFFQILPGYSQKQKDPATLEAFELLCHHTQVDSGQGEVWKHKLLESPHQDHIFAMQPLFIDIVNYISSDHDTIEANKV